MNSRRNAIVVVSSFGLVLAAVVWFVLTWSDAGAGPPQVAGTDVAVVQRPAEALAPAPLPRAAAPRPDSAPAVAPELVVARQSSDGDMLEALAAKPKAEYETPTPVALSGTVVLQDETPLPGHYVVQVSLIQTHLGTVARSSTEAVTDTNGRFTIPDALPGTSSLIVKGPRGGDVWGHEWRSVTGTLEGRSASSLVRVVEERKLNFLCELGPQKLTIVSCSHADRRLVGIAMTDSGTLLANAAFKVFNQARKRMDLGSTNSAGFFETLAAQSAGDTVSLCFEGYAPVSIGEVTTDWDLGVVEFKATEEEGACETEPLGY